MKRTFLETYLVAAIGGAALLSGCAAPNGGSYSHEAGAAAPAAGGKPASGGTIPPAPLSQAAPVPVPPTPEQLALREGVEMYNRGDFKDAIKRLSVPEVSNGSKATQLAALKYTAFSYCLTGRQTLCRQQFDKAFKLDPAFDLAQGEHGHPMWGKAFDRAKKGRKP